MSNNWRNYKKKALIFRCKEDQKDQCFLFQAKISEKSELEVDEQSENRPSNSNMENMVHDFVVQGESSPSTSTSSAKSQFTHVAESETWFLAHLSTTCSG